MHSSFYLCLLLSATLVSGTKGVKRNSPVIVGGHLKFVVICNRNTVLPCTGLFVPYHIKADVI
ncbi:hypothetical protein AKJ16_DCAP14879 [Drosera capensis]